MSPIHKASDGVRAEVTVDSGLLRATSIAFIKNEIAPTVKDMLREVEAVPGLKQALFDHGARITITIQPDRKTPAKPKS